MAEEKKTEKVTENETRIRFNADDNDNDRSADMFVAERNRGQSLFDDHPDAFVVLDANQGEGGWYMTKDEATQLHAWLGRALAE